MAFEGTDGHVQILPDSTGKKMDTLQTTTGSGSVHRSRVQLVEEIAANTFGENVAVVPSATVVLVSFAAPTNWKLTGVLLGGEADGKFVVKFDGVVKYVSRTNVARRDGSFYLPHPDSDAGGKTVNIEVTNSGQATAGFEATLLGI